MLKTWRFCVSLMVVFSCISATIFMITGDWNGLPGSLLSLLLWSGILYGSTRKSPVSAMLSLTFFVLGGILTAISPFIFVNHASDTAIWAYCYFAVTSSYNLLGAISSWHAWQKLRSA